MRKNCESMAFLVMVTILLLAVGSVYGETAPKQDNTTRGFVGQVKSIDCAKGELTLTGKMGKDEGVFLIGKDVEFRNIKGCEEIIADGTVTLYYSEVEGRKIVKSVLFRHKREPAKSPPRHAAKESMFMGWVNSVDCDKGSIALEKLDNRSIVESFSLGKEVAIEVGPSNKCPDIQKGSVVVVVFDEKDSSKVARRVKQMAGGKR